MTELQTNAPRINLSAGSGKGVKVAVIDSGINAQHSHVQRVAGGVRILLGPGGALEFLPDWQDSLGHGTAIAGVLRAKAPDVELYSVKVFDRQLRTQAEIVAAAIRWAADNRMDIANCSLGTAEAAHRPLLQRACEYAAGRGVIVVAASESPDAELFPACLPGVISVAGDENCGWDEFYACGRGTPAFRAHPSPRPLPGRPQERNLRGHSFAAAHIAACLVRLCEQLPPAERHRVSGILLANSSRTRMTAGDQRLNLPQEALD
ncbi:MAG: S8 family serine peptidase [Acidobacteriia bacterium]|nr:S8 family serine peptidase [Terriglobia bacterium]